MPVRGAGQGSEAGDEEVCEVLEEDDGPAAGEEQEAGALDELLRVARQLAAADRLEHWWQPRPPSPLVVVVLGKGGGQNMNR